MPIIDDNELTRIVEAIKPFRDFGQYVVNHQLNLSNDMPLKSLSGIEFLTKGQLIELMLAAFKLDDLLSACHQGALSSTGKTVTP